MDHHGSWKTGPLLHQPAFPVKQRDEASIGSLACAAAFWQQLNTKNHVYKKDDFVISAATGRATSPHWWSLPRPKYKSMFEKINYFTLLNGLIPWSVSQKHPTVHKVHKQTTELRSVAMLQRTLNRGIKAVFPSDWTTAHDAAWPTEAWYHEVCPCLQRNSHISPSNQLWNIMEL